MIHLPKGFRYAGVHCGLKSNPEELDLTLVVSDLPATVAGTYTQNKVFGAAVEVDRARTPGTGFRALVANSRIANDCTGEQGLQDALEMTKLAAQCVDAEPDKALVMSTGVIGMFMPMAKIRAGITEAARQLADDESAFLRAARGIMTTDTVEKTASRQIELKTGETITIAGFCKGAAMIAPNMRTMLAMVMTDLALTPEVAQEVLSDVVENSFNCISVDGHTSPSDTVLFYANGAVPTGELCEYDWEHFKYELRQVCRDLARQIPADGEGAAHLITIDVLNCIDRESAKKIAQQIANDPLVKTAVYGADPNWGRIVSAAGNAGVPFDLTKFSLSINGYDVFLRGKPVHFDKKAVSDSIRDNRRTHLFLYFGEGEEYIRFWTTDLTCEYVRLNSDYTT